MTTSLLGYGGTAERRTAGDTDISHEAEAVEAVIRRAACPVHLVGHSFGGLAALAVALRRRVPLLSLTIAEAPAAEILRPMGEYRHYLAFRNMTDNYFLAHFSGDKTAIEQMIDFYGGAGTFSGWPQRLRDYAIETTPVNLLDWASAYGFELTPDIACDGQNSRAGIVGRRPVTPPPNAPTNCWPSACRKPAPPKSRERPIS